MEMPVSIPVNAHPELCETVVDIEINKAGNELVLHLEQSPGVSGKRSLSVRLDKRVMARLSLSD